MQASLIKTVFSNKRVCSQSQAYQLESDLLNSLTLSAGGLLHQQITCFFLVYSDNFVCIVNKLATLLAKINYRKCVFSPK